MTEKSLRGQVAVVFGASSGIGRATALALAERGASICLAARRRDALMAVADEIAGNGGTALVCTADVIHRVQVDAAMDAAVRELGRLDVVVNAAGVNVPDRRMEVLSEASWNRILSVNLTGAFHTTQAPLTHMRTHGGGLIIQIASVSGRYADNSGPAYQASKHGVVGLAHATMLEERAHGVRVSVILPGLVDTPFPLQRATPPPRSLLDRAMQPQDVALACAFLAELPPRVYIPELMMFAGQLQCLGQTIV